MTRKNDPVQNRKAQSRYYRRKVKAAECVYAGCHMPARPSRRYCERHKGREGRRK